MTSAWQVFQECGWPSWLSLLTGMGATVAAMVALGTAVARVRVAVLLAWLALTLALLPLGVGALGMALQRSKVDAVLTTGAIDPSQLARIREEGYREAGSCVAVGGAFTGLPLLLAGLGVGVAHARRARGRDAAEGSDS